MPPLILLDVVEGALTGERFLFRETARVVIGRSSGCELRLPDNFLHWDVSRRHCLLDFSPPDATIRDLESRNGAYVNEKKIGQREVSPEAGKAHTPPAPHRLRAGDRIRVGHTVFEVDIRPARPGAEDATEILSGEPDSAG